MILIRSSPGTGNITAPRICSKIRESTRQNSHSAHGLRAVRPLLWLHHTSGLPNHRARCEPQNLLKGGGTSCCTQQLVDSKGVKFLGSARRLKRPKRWRTSCGRRASATSAFAAHPSSAAGRLLVNGRSGRCAIGCSGAYLSGMPLTRKPLAIPPEVARQFAARAAIGLFTIHRSRQSACSYIALKKETHEQQRQQNSCSCYL